MVGSLAMAGAVEDYGIQECKKPRKDDDPHVQTITNYFSPLAKTVDKVFSPPKSNNIRDYFKSTPPSKDNFTPNGAKISPIVKPSDNDKDPQFPVITSQKSLKCKKRGKRLNLQSRLSDVNPPEPQSVVDITSDDSHQSQEAEAACRSFGFMGSDTAALLAEICNENVELSRGEEQLQLSSSLSVTCKKTTAKHSLQRKSKNDSRKSRKRKFEDDETSSPSISLENQTDEQMEGEAKLSPDSQENLSSSLTVNRSTSVESSLEVHVDETSKLNDSIVTVSFEDFLKSQGDKGADAVLEIEAPVPEHCVSDALEEETSVADHSLTNSDADESGSGLEKSDNPVSVKTLTILAQVHSSPPEPPTKLKLKKSKTKFASIFLKKNCELEMECEEFTTDVEPAEQMILKRKSNVVIEEEDLELAVLEVGGSEPAKPKSTVEERQQFMKAFRQPASDAGKSVIKKASGKLQELNEKPSKDKRKVNDDADNDLIKNCGKNKRASGGTSDSAEAAVETKETRQVKTKKLKKRKKKVVEISDAETASQVQDTFEKAQDKNIESNTVSMEDNLNEGKSPVVEKGGIVLRRSSRQQSAERSQSKTPVKSDVGDAVLECVPDDVPLQVSTPKVRKVRCAASDNKLVKGPSVSTPKVNRKSLDKNNLYKSEMMSAETHSPIRMRFTRLSYRGHINDSGTGEDAQFTPRSRKVTDSSKKISEAKKLVKKAKTIKHNLSKSTLETHTLLRRSSRQQARSERKPDCETEDCVLVDSGSEHAPVSRRKLKKNTLRSLNDVLGKSCKSKPAKNVTGQVKMSLRGKKDKMSLGPITIDDDDSKDVSEDSQDEEQCKAKREFLMSGLPDSLKRHIAKTTAAMEAYSAASLCYQAVTHVQQKDCCLMWSLPWPSATSLNKLQQRHAGATDITKLSISLGTFSDVNSKLNKAVSADMLSGWRVHVSEVVRRCLLEEIRSFNPQFPVRKVLKQFLKRRTENHVLPLTNMQGSTDSTNPEMNSELMCCSDSEKENKRKDVDPKSKRRKPTSSSEDLSKMAEVNPVGRRRNSGEVQTEASTKGKLTRASRKKQTCAETPAEKPDNCDIILIEDSVPMSEVVTTTTDLTCEDVLWTEKYQPQDSSELIGNSGAIKKLHSWLKEWKARADREEQRSQREKKPENKQQDTWGQSDFDDYSEDEEDDLLCNTVLITGPPGVGKTAAVYACAQELGFKVFEVNASCQRSGRQILSQLKEATQSHQVDKQGLNAHKPCFFSSSNASKSPRKVNSPRKDVASPRKPLLSPRGAGLKRSLPPKSLSQFFKPSSKEKKDDDNSKQPGKSKSVVDNLVSSKGKEGQSTAKEGAKEMEKEGSEESNRKNATSLILFEEVDVIFEDDFGFLSAIKTFMTTTKRPVILTTSDPTFSLLFDGLFEEINFRTPSPINIASYLQVLCLAENLRTDVKDFATLLAMNNCDIRRSVLFLQFWVRSGGGYMKDKALSICDKTDSETVPAGCAEDSADFKMTSLSEENSHDLPKCDTGCSENLLGLKNILSPSEDLMSFIKYNILKTDERTKLVLLLQEFQRKNVHFIFNNIEFLLPLPVNIQESNEPSDTQGAITDAIPSDATSLPKARTIKSDDDDGSAEASPVKMSMGMKRRRKLVLLNDSDLYECDSNSADGFLTLPKDTPTVGSEETKGELTPAVEDLKPKTLMSNMTKKTFTPSEKQCSALVSHCLDSLTKFVDDVSFLDCCLYTDIGEQNDLKHMEYNWTSGRIKNGLCDGYRLEHRDWWSTQSCGELKAIVEVLSFQNCCSSISQDMESSLEKCKELGQDPTEALTLHVSKHRDDVFFSQSAVSVSVAQKRLSLVKDVFSNRSFMTVGNRQASIVEYLPILRNICKSEKLKEQGKMKRRFLHYFEAISLELPKATLRSLAEDFP